MVMMTNAVVGVKIVALFLHTFWCNSYLEDRSQLFSCWIIRVVDVLLVFIAASSSAVPRPSRIGL
jgi:hypothetical protein